MVVLSLSIPFGVASFAYLVVALQLRSGLPPFYFRTQSRDDVIAVLVAVRLRILILFLIILAAFFVPYQIGGIAIGVASLSIALAVRHDVSQSSSGPLPWLGMLGMVGPRMALFDAWSIGFALFFFLLFLI